MPTGSKADQVAEKIVRIEWDRTKGTTPTDDKFYAAVVIGDDFEVARVQVSRNDYANDHSVPAESKAKRIRAEIAKILRQEYSE